MAARFAYASLTGCNGCIAQLVAGDTPDAFNALAGVDEDRSRRERYKGHQQRVFDKVLTLFVPEKTLHLFH